MHFVAHTGDVVRGTNFPTNFHLRPGDGFDLPQHSPNRSPSHSPLLGRKKHSVVYAALNGFNSNNDVELKDSRSAFGSRKSSVDKELPIEHDCVKEHCKRVVINVSGMKYETQLKTLNRLPNTLLGDPAKRAEYWDPKRKEYFFDRHRPTFAAILFYYQSGGRLKRPFEVPLDIFLEELNFYELGRSVIDSLKQGEGFIFNAPPMPSPKNPVQRFFYELFEVPESSFAAKVVAIISVIFIVTSVVTFCVETLPNFHGTECSNTTVNITDENGTFYEENVLSPDFMEPLFLIESSCIAWFTVEFAIRLASFPSKWEFFKDVINYIDFIAILPYFIFVSMRLLSMDCSDSKTGGLAVLRVLRVTRILKLSKHSEGLQILGKTLTTSLKELSMFCLFLGIGIIIFSASIFFAEQSQPNSHFESIPGAFWWAVVSMTTVGYGDNYPTGPLGKLIGSFCVLSGVLAIALPVPVIVANFNQYYSASKGRGGYGYSCATIAKPTL